MIKPKMPMQAHEPIYISARILLYFFEVTELLCSI